MPSVLITGANRGIGRALTEQYSSKGWLTFAVIRNASFVSELTNINQNKIIPIVADVGTDVCKDIIGAAIRNHESALDVLINNAGVSGRSSELETVSCSELEQLFQIHCLGALRCTQACLP